ncbi:hypothetical protein DFH94DRAFT_324662 [Russula ochroleuca]|uniref:Uncharacterized protein n=1 Tax=Russula ochroleuca TaxID=152965 RepID=A0A9P5N1A2_9AGAM|nr:hypothetical protein DFH94DRAFT_324662 [Russula ochroleuca]
MLALSRSTRAAHTLRLHARALSTVAPSASTTPNTDAEQLSGNNHAPDDQTAAAREAQAWFSTSGAECMHVSPWGTIHSSAEGLAIARAVQDKYGVTAKEVVFSRDINSVNLFQPYFWLVFDDPNVRKCLLEPEEMIAVTVPDFPERDGNIGVEEMIRALGLSTTDSMDPHHHAPSPPTKAEPSKSASDAPPPPPEGYKTLDVRVAWADFGPAEIRNRKRFALASLLNEGVLPRFATAWLAFDGFSPESARGPHTLNLSRAREKWSKLAPPASALSADNNDNVTAAAAVSSSSEGTAEVEEEAMAETMAETQENRTFSREWVPIMSSSPLAQRPRPASVVPPKNNSHSNDASAPDGPSLITPLTADATDTAADTPDATLTPAPAGIETTKTSQGPKLSRREYILHLARQNARTPSQNSPRSPCSSSRHRPRRKSLTKRRVSGKGRSGRFASDSGGSLVAITSFLAPSPFFSHPIYR